MTLRTHACRLGVGCNAVAIAALAGAGIARAQDAACDSTLRPRPETPYAYRLRGDRCEGVYVEQVGGTPLWVASLTAEFRPYDLTTGKDIRLQWGGAGDSEFRIRVRGIERDLYYGMDARRPAGTRVYDWPSNVLASLRITRSRIGALGWTERKIGGSWREVYVPLRISQEAGQARADGYELVLFPGEKLKEVYVTLGPADASGRPLPDKLLKDREAQQHGFYPAERPIRIHLPPLEPGGLYYLRVSATRPAGQPVAPDPLLIDTSEK